MRRDTILILFFICGFLFMGSGKVWAETLLPIGYYEKLHKVINLPQEENYNTSEGQHVDLGIKYTVYEFLGLPLYQQSDAIFIGYLDNRNYLLFSEELISTIASLNNIDNIYALKKLPFWDRWGGKLVLLSVLIFLLVVIGMFYKKKTTPIYPLSSSSLQ